jgi:Dual specificity phosphatase, catalytic domain
MYHEQDFIDSGIDHIEAFFLDGSCPSREILLSVIDAFENVPAEKAFAVHCKAGLGRTGTCIGAYLMKHYGFTAKEVIAWMRICRPGCVIGPQQHYLAKIERFMWEQGVAEGYIELPVDDSSSSPTVASRPTKVKDAEMTDAIIGRAGQADALLAARSRRPGATTGGADNTKNSPSSTKVVGVEKLVLTTTSSGLTSAPATPDMKLKPSVATVTPEQAATSGVTTSASGVQATALWCG